MYEDEDAALHVEPFRPAGTDYLRGWVEVLEAPEHIISVLDAEGMRRAGDHETAEGEPLAQAAGHRCLEAVMAYRFHGLPACLSLSVRERDPQITASTLAYVSLQEGIVDVEAQVRVRVERRGTDVFRLELGQGMLVLEAGGGGVADWDVVEDGIVEVRTPERILGEFMFYFTAVEHLQRVDGVRVPGFRVKNAVRQSGAVGVSTTEELGLSHREAAGYRQIDPDELPGPLRDRKPQLAYSYELSGERDERFLTVSTRIVQPELLVEGVGVAIVREEAVEEEYVFECTVSRRPIFRIMLRLPEDLIPTSLFGDYVSDWEFHPESGLITVRLERGLRDTARIHLFCERRIAPQAETVLTGGVTVLGADHVSGVFGVGAGANIQLRPVQTEAMTSMDLRDTPVFISTHDDVNFAFRWSSEDWWLRGRPDPLDPIIRAQTSTALIFGSGFVRAVAGIDWNIDRAGVQEIQIRLPDRAVPVAVDGRGVQRADERDGLWTIRLADPVTGRYSMQVQYEMHPERGREKFLYRGLELPQADRVSGLVSVFLLDPRIEVSVADIWNVRRAAEMTGVELEGMPSLGTFAYGRHERSIEFDVRGHGLAEGVLIRADDVWLGTIVKKEGRAVSYMQCSLINAGEQYFSFRLPEGGLLWGTYADGEPVRPVYGEDGKISLPLLGLPRNAPFTVSVAWAQAAPKMGVGTSLNLLAPEMDLPAQAVNWELHLPRGYQVIGSGGNMELLRRELWHEQGLPGILYGKAAAVLTALATAAAAALPLIAGLAGIGLFAAGVFFFVRWSLPLTCRLRRRREQNARKKAFRPIPALLSILILCLAIAVLASMLMPAMSRSRAEARKAASGSNLRQIGLVLAMFRDDHDGRLPQSLDALLETGYLDNEELLVSPGSGKRYEYAGPLDPDEAGPAVPIVWEIYEDPKVALVLFMDSTVRFIREGDSEFALLPESVRIALRTPEPVRMAGRDALEIQPTLTESELSTELSAIPDERGLAERAKRRIEAPSPDILGMKSAVGERFDSAADRLRAAEERIDRRTRALQMAESYRRRGDLDKAAEQFEQALEHDPDCDDARSGLRRIRRLQESVATEGFADAFGMIVEDALQVRRSHPAAGLLAYDRRLDAELEPGWRGRLASTQDEAMALSLIAGEAETVGLSGGAELGREGDEFVIEGAESEVQEARALLSRLQEVMAEEARELTRLRHRSEEELAARRRAEARRRREAMQARPQAGLGTVSGSRGAGPLPIELTLPIYGTERYPFRMDYAGASRPRITVTGVRTSAAVVMQGAVAVLLFALVLLVGLSMPRRGLILTGALALILVLMLAAGGAAVPYAVMGLAGVVLALPAVFWRPLNAGIRARGRPGM